MRVEGGGLLSVIAGKSKTEYQTIARDSGVWENWFHLSDNRANVVEWLDVEPGSVALEIGAQAGAISAVLKDKYQRYVALDYSDDMKRICMSREDTNGIEYEVAKLMDFAASHPEEFDDIYMIGCLAEAEAYTGIPHGYEKMLRAVLGMLKPKGRCIVASENRFGMKYWAGCREDYTGRFYENIEGFPNTEDKRTFSKRELDSLLKSAGFCNTDWYYPYPDIYLSEAVFSDDCLPKPGELNNNIINYDRDRIMAFDEIKVFDSVMKEGMFPFFANSYLMIAYKDKKPADKKIFVKYSKQRDRRFAIRTDIVLKGENRFVKKEAVYPEGREHLDSIYRAYEELKTVYEKQNLHLNECIEKDGQKCFQYVEGKNLQTMIEDLIQQEKMREAEELFDTYVKRCFLDRETVAFHMTEGFRNRYGDVSIPEGMPAFEKGDCDLICSNIFVDKDKWTVIDYEWSVDFPVPVKYLLYRSLFLAHHQIKSCDFLKLDVLMKKYNISEEEQKLFSEMESNFQKYVQGDVISDVDVFFRIGKGVYTIKDWNELRDKYQLLLQENDRLRMENERQNKHRSFGFGWLKRLGRR